MHVARIELTNWGPFAGEHVIELEPTTYGIVGPNWSGKSRLIAAVPFALFGTNPERLEDEWITNGASSGMVAVQLSTGARVERGRRRGKSTQVVLKLGGAEAQGANALAEIARLAVLDEDEFFLSCYLRQKQIGQLVTMLPSDRVRVLSGWIGLAQADRAIEIAGGLLELVEAELEGSERELKQATGWIDAACAEHAFQDADRGARAARLAAHLEQQLADAEAEVERVTTDAEGEAASQREQEYARLVVEGKQAKAALAAMQSVEEIEKGRDAAAAVVTEYDGELGSARADRRRSLAIVEGEFDGTCPVVGIQCPVRETLEAAKAEAEQRVADIDARILELQGLRETSAAVKVEWDELERARGSRAEKLEAMRARAGELIAELGKARAAELAKAGPGGATDEDELATRRRLHSDRLVAAGQALEAARSRHSDVCASIEDLAKLEARVHEQRQRARVAGAAVVVCERARREVMRESASEIERGANKVLGQCGVELEVAFRWEREGKGHARNCAECGAGFPTSAKVKECARCGAKRGPLMTDKLELVPSDVSGAAEDLAGVAVQLSAARWLRARKGAPWSTAFIDEPFGALDSDNRRALAQHLAAALSGEGGFRQALVVAHQPDALAGMQRRIEIVPGPSGSRCVVS